MTHWRIVSLVAAATFIISGGVKTLSQEQQPAKPLPRVLLIGDSIRGSYGKGVQQLLAGKAEVSLNDKNAQYTGWGLKKIDEWLGDGKWDIIHFNWGLWDMYGWEYFNEDRSPAKYEERLELLVSRMKKTGAKLIWATTTPACPEPEKAMRDRFNRQVRITASVEKEYQDAALRVMKKHQVAVNDLHALMLPDLEKFQLGPRRDRPRLRRPDRRRVRRSPVRLTNWGAKFADRANRGETRSRLHRDGSCATTPINPRVDQRPHCSREG